MSSRRRLLTASSCLIVLLAVGGTVVAQMEAGDRGILPIDSTGTLEIDGIHVDVGGKDAASARYAGWRIAQREGFKKLWAKQHGRPESEAPNLSDSVLDGLVSSIVVDRENIGPTRYIADLGILFDRARAGELLGMSGEVRRSAPMLLVPVMISGGTATTVEIKNPWQRAWAQFRTSQSPVDYVRISGMGVDPLLVNAAQTGRPGRGWWRNIIDLYGAADILVAEVSVQRLYPGGPAYARFVGRHGPDGEILGGFDLKAKDSADIPRMMAEGVQRMDELFTRALAAGELVRDPTLITVEPPPPVEDELAAIQPVAQVPLSGIQIQILTRDDAGLNNAVAQLRTIPGMEGVGVRGGDKGWSILFVNFRGNNVTLASAIRARGWTVSDVNGTLRVVPALQIPGAPSGQ
ncbi:heavy-metal-associated domain-containing protein [Sphingomonas alba]|uniref:Heavy-metal-associated domain-containing protein n=1 Tax=Sphingomonas alba TaxID=2908208 RepID=A0ABT0RJI1_9SPHN|nr:heavy-metal-associated domain-containing protein [Sphingomonas alba]MCL6682791.1 heavy-metal-associated domain-containing protein [Sphingomonas alba]